MFARKAQGRLGQDGRLGQVVVEMLLILPVFLTIVFTIMELGYLSFWVIVLNHATYEVARIGALRAGPDPYPLATSIKDVTGAMNDKMRTMIPGSGSSGPATVTSVTDFTLRDRQAGQDNFDLVVTGSYDVRFIFPISSILMSSPLLCPRGPGGGRCRISTTIRMPIEQPLNR